LRTFSDRRLKAAAEQVAEANPAELPQKEKMENSGEEPTAAVHVDSALTVAI